MNTETPQSSGELRRFIGLVLIVIGALWMAASGLCTAVFGISLFAEGTTSDLAEAGSIILLMLVYGGVSALAGLGVYAIGRALRPRQ